jgi:hypothetical protein
MAEVLREAETLLRAALQEGRPKGTSWEVVRLYHDTDQSRGKTEAVLAACLSNWQGVAQHIDEAMQEDRPLEIGEITSMLIHKAFLRKRCKDYRDRQMAEQVARAKVTGSNGEYLPFDPADLGERKQSLKLFGEEIALVLKERSVRDRMVIELRADGYSPREIVDKVKAALPDEPMSEPTVSRIIQRFGDDLRRLLDDQ